MCPYSSGNLLSNRLEDALGKRNVVAIHKTKADFITEHTAPFSIKYVLQGSESYMLDNQRLQVDVNRYLIINRNQCYASSISSQDITVSFCIFFSEQSVSDAYRQVMVSPENLLDNDFYTSSNELNFRQKLYWRDARMNTILSTFRDRQVHENLSPLLLDEWCADILSVLMESYTKEGRRIQSLTQVRRSTRQELYRRLCLSIDFIHANYHEPLKLEQLSQVACLSSFHFLRSFKDVFKLTPHQYVTSIRLQEACRLLKTKYHSVGDVITACGFEDESSFSRLFKKHIGQTPQNFRKQF